MKLINFDDEDFNDEFEKILNRGEGDIENVSNIVHDIIANVKKIKTEL